MITFLYADVHSILILVFITGFQRHVALPNQEQVTVVGRVCLDGREGKLNASSVLLEGSRETSNGARVALDLSVTEEFSLFPGQIIAAEGTNTTGTVGAPRGPLHGGSGRRYFLY